jgi:chemotaxis protein histidine kinase CheA
MQMPNHPHEDQFLEEVLGLFALEAQEWISQSKAALLELEGRPALDREAKLYETITCGISNLGGSAATVELPALETLAFALVPLLQAMGKHKGHTPPEQISVLREGLDAIIWSVEHLAETKTGEVSGLERILQKLADAAALPPLTDPIPTLQTVPSRPAVMHTPMPASSPTLMETLHSFQRTHAESADPMRHMVEAVIRKVKAEEEKQEGSQIDPPSIMRILEELDALDERFLAELHQRLPMIISMLSDLKAGRLDELKSNSRLESALRDIHTLQDAARTLDAKAIMLFFHGLHTFLTLVGKKSITILPQRFEAVESRLQEILPTAQQWVDTGKGERASIQKIVFH